MAKRWNDLEITNLGFLIQSGHTNKEIAELLKKSYVATQLASRRYYGGNPNFHKNQIKHKHLRQDVFKYFLNHSKEETIKHFKISESNFKSIFTAGYRDRKLAHLRKDKRRKDEWTTKELQFLLSNAGIKSRQFIARKLKRGSYHSVKDRLQMLGVSSRYINGLTLSKFKQIFGQDPFDFVQTSAGPSTLRHCSHFKLVPWVWIDEWIKSGKLKPHRIIVLYVQAMSDFNKWIEPSDI